MRQPYQGSFALPLPVVSRNHTRKRMAKASPYKLPRAVPVTAGRYQHAGTILRAIIDGHGASVLAVTRALGVNRQHFIAVMDAKANLTRDLAYKVGAAFGDAAADLLIAAQRAWEDQEGEALRAQAKASIQPWQTRE